MHTMEACVHVCVFDLHGPPPVQHCTSTVGPGPHALAVAWYLAQGASPSTRMDCFHFLVAARPPSFSNSACRRGDREWLSERGLGGAVRHVICGEL